MRGRTNRGPQSLEDVINWQLVVRRYYQIHGIDEGSNHDVEKHDNAGGGHQDKVFNMTELVNTAYSNYKNN